MLKILQMSSEEERAWFNSRQKLASDENIQRTVSEIIDDIRLCGWESVCKWSGKLDGAIPRLIDHSEIEEAYNSCPVHLIDDMKKAAERIWDYQSRLLSKDHMWTNPDGGHVGFIVRPLSCAGMYVPGGTAAYPSTVLMNGIPAKAAGVEKLVMVTPPTKYLKPEVLASAKIVGVDSVFALGGVQALAALAYGIGPVPKADKIVGPGNAYVTQAKKQLYGMVDIDMLAGPSELLIIADDSADPGFAAADMLSQAEHDKLASAVLVTTSPRLAQAVCAELQAQLHLLPRASIARASLENFGICIVCPDLISAANCANSIAPEHLEVMTEKPEELLPLLKNAGAIFLGQWSPEPLGDYWAGPSHVLPTLGTARFSSPLSAESFLKKTSVISYNRDALEKTFLSIERFALSEELQAHAASVKRRFL